jgi:hypothetical protein
MFMTEMIAKCGCNCSRCSTYKENLKTNEDRIRCSRGWKEYLSLSLSPEKLRLCDGCQVPDKQRKVYYLNCIVRKCAMENGIENCAYCSIYPCEEVSHLHITFAPGFREKIEKKLGKKIPDRDYLDFIECFEGIKHLNDIRKTIDKNKIVEFKKFSIQSKLTPFPKDIKKKKELIYKSLYDLIDKINGNIDDLSYLARESLKKKRPPMLTLLWTFGVYGKLNKKDENFLTINSLDYAKEKNQCMYDKLMDCFNILKNYGANLELTPLIEEGWITPTGGLRAKIGKKEDPLWIMTLSFDTNAGGSDGLVTLCEYSKKLLSKYGEKAFKHFSIADMKVLC